MFPKLLSIIYETRLFAIIPLFAAWLVLTIMLLIHRNKLFYVSLLILPLIIFPIDIGSTYCGWLYRMKLVRLYATAPDHSIDIDRMPPQIRSEYARHDYHPRFRDIKAKLLGAVVATPILIAIGSAAWMLVLSHHRNKHTD